MAETREAPRRWAVEEQAADPSLRVEVRHVDGGATLRLIGEFDLTGIEGFERSAPSLLFRYDGRQIDIDCSELRFIDAAGVGKLVRVASSVQGGPVTLTDTSPRVRHVLPSRVPTCSSTSPSPSTRSGEAGRGLGQPAHVSADVSCVAVRATERAPDRGAAPNRVVVQTVGRLWSARRAIR